jgi:hypothetical protein
MLCTGPFNLLDQQCLHTCRDVLYLAPQTSAKFDRLSPEQQVAASSCCAPRPLCFSGPVTLDTCCAVLYVVPQPGAEFDRLSPEQQVAVSRCLVLHLAYCPPRSFHQQLGLSLVLCGVLCYPQVLSFTRCHLSIRWRPACQALTERAQPTPRRALHCVASCSFQVPSLTGCRLSSRWRPARAWQCLHAWSRCTSCDWWSC